MKKKFILSTNWYQPPSYVLGELFDMAVNLNLTKVVQTISRITFEATEEELDLFDKALYEKVSTDKYGKLNYNSMIFQFYDGNEKDCIGMVKNHSGVK